MSPSQPLLLARERAGLSLDEMALLVGLEPSRLAALERGDEYAPPQIVERCATVLGLSTAELLGGEEPTAVALLFRRMSREGGPFAEAVDAGMADALGRFVRAARTVARLRAILAEGPSTGQLAWLERFKPLPLVPRPDLYAQAAEMAAAVRSYLGFGEDDEIPSMRAVLARLGIITMFVDPDQVDRDIDGASLLNPQPAVLVNLVGGGDKYWRTRMTLAHELCHLFFDRAELDPDNPRRFFIFSPKRRPYRQQTSLHLFAHFDDLEARANAFAGDFLAPTNGVRRRTGSLDPTSPEAIARLISHYKIGKETAVNRLKNAFGLSEEQRQRMLVQPTREIRSSSEHPDSVRTGTNLYDESFVDLVMRAFSRSKLDGVEARSLLNLRLSDPLPEHPSLSPSRRAPLRGADDSARTAAEDHLYRRAGLEYFVESIEPAGDGWRAQITRRSESGQHVRVGELHLGPDLSISEDSALKTAFA